MGDIVQATVVKASDGTDAHKTIKCKLENGLSANINYHKWDIDNFDEYKQAKDSFRPGSIMTGRINKICFNDKNHQNLKL